MYTPPVASLACCSRTVSPASFKISMGIRFLCAAKIEFITGMYWFARSPDTETMRMREVSDMRSTWAFSESASAAREALSADAAVGACRIVCLLICVSARDRAPPISVVGVASRWLSLVSFSSLTKFCSMALSTTANGRYLFALSAVCRPASSPAPFISTSPFVAPFRDCGCSFVGVGYRNVVLCECDAMTATSLVLPEAKCALMNTRILARAAESESVEDRCAQACGLVSSTMASREGGGAEMC